MTGNSRDGNAGVADEIRRAGTPASVSLVRAYRVIESSQRSEPFSVNDEGGRWTSPSTPAIYCSRSASTALLEFMVHLEEATPDQLLLAVATLPGECVTLASGVPADWRERPYRRHVQAIGDEWARRRQSLALQVPSAVCDQEYNLIVNPAHPDFSKLRVLRMSSLHWDPRLSGRGS